jgi:pheromone shutdown protein TraB
MSKTRKSAVVAAFAPELTIVLALVFLVALIAWYGKDWLAKLLAPFQYWYGSLAAIGSQAAYGDWYGAYLSLQGRIASAINSWKGQVSDFPKIVAGVNSNGTTAVVQP